MTSSEIRTLPQLLLQTASRSPINSAMRRKQRGVWQATTFQSYADAAIDVALALRSDNVSAGETVLIAACNSPEWLIADAGIMMAGARSAALYPDMAPNERLSILSELDPAVVFCGGHEQVDQILEAEEGGSLRRLARIVYFDAIGLGPYSDPRLISFEAYCVPDRSHETQRPELLRSVERAGPDDIAVVALTRGVSGAVRAVPLSHEALLKAGRRLADNSFRNSRSSRILAYLPLASALARQHTVTLQLLTEGQLCFPEEGQDLIDVVREVQPDVVALFPNGWSELAAALTLRLEQSSKLPARLRRRALFRPGTWLEQAVFARGMRAFIGLKHVERAFCLGGVPDHMTRNVLDKLGIELLYAYGVTELAGVTHVSPSPSDLLKHPLPDISISADDAGEIRIVAGPGLSVATGDRVDGIGGQQNLIGRADDMFSAAGRGMALNRVEEALRDSRWIRRAAACRHNDSIHLLIEIDAGSTGRWAAERKLAFTDFASLTALTGVRTLISEEVERRLEGIAGAELVRAHTLLDRPFNLDAGELAPVYGLRRHRAAGRLERLLQEA